MDYIAQPKDYWIAPNAVNITLNALGNPNRTQGSVASGAAILCYIEGVAGLGYDNGHRFKTWPLSISPTYFNSNTAKYVYVAIPRSTSVGTQAVVVFPSEKLDIYGKNVGNAQLGSTDYYYIWLQGIITATNGTSIREWAPRMNFGQKGTDEDLYDDTTSDWYQYSKVSEVVTFLKNIAMKAGTTFQNLILGYKELTGVATSDIAYTDSDTLVATPGYVESQYLSKTHESEAQEQIGFLKGLWIGVRNLYEITANGIAKLKSVIAEDVNTKRVQTGEIKSPNYTGDGVADTGFRLTNSHNGHSKLTIDELYVRMKAVFESLEVRERTYTGGDQIWSCAGNKIIRVDYLGNVETADHVPQMMRVHSNGQPASQEEQDDVYSVPVPGDTYGYSDVKVPWLLRQMPLLARAKVFARYRKVRIVLNEPSASGARRAAAESPLANIRRARCYFLAKDDDMEVHNWWRINDLARCQTMNLANVTRQTYLSGENQKAGNIFWWRKVIGVSYEPVTLDDGKQYHYFDVAFDYEYEQSHPEVMATSVMEGSDIPAAQDSVVQFGNTIIEGRMNLMMMEVNGSDAVGYNPTTDAPCLKAYRGIYSFDLNKCWIGGKCCKMKLSPKTGYEFYGPNFKQVTEYDVVPVPVDRGLWTDITPTRDDYREHEMVRKCYYYDKVSHNGSYWLCSIVDGAHWVDSSGNYISDADYSTLTEAQKALCERHQSYTIEEPSADSTDWTLVVEKGEKGDTGDDAIYANIAPANVLVATSENGVVSTEQTSEHLVEFFKGSAKQTNEFSRIICTIDSITLDSEYHDEYTPRKYYKVVLTRSSGHLTGGLTLSVNSGFTLTSEVMQVVAVMTIGGESVSRTLELPIKALRQGEAGDDAIVLKADPENVIITQSTEQQGGSYPFIVVDTWSGTDIFGFTQLKIVDGGTEKTSGFTVGTPVPSKIPGTQTNSCTCTVSGTKVGITAIGSASGIYATSGYVTIPVTYGGKSYQVVWNFYCNLLGTWKQSVENGTETSISSQLSYELFGDRVHTISQEGQYIRGWAENTSRLSKEIYDSMISDISGWWPLDGDASIIRYDALNLGVIVESNSVYTPVVHLDTGKTYCFAAYFASNPSGGIFAYGSNTSQPNGQEVEENGNELSDYSSVQTTDQSIRIGGTTYYLYYIYFTVQASERYVSIQIAASCYRPRIIEGKTPIVTSLIKQTADEVDMSVRGALGDAGINIIGDTREVNLIAGKVNFKTAGGQTNPKISIDPTTGTLNAVDGIFDGTVVAKVLKQMVCEAYPSRNEQNINLLTIDPNGGETIYAEYYHTEFASDDASYAAVYVREHGINVGDIFYVDSTIVSAFTESNFYVNTGFATYVVITDQYYDGVKKYFPVDGTKGIIRIPKPSDCIGMVITFINACDGRNINGNWAQGSAHIRCSGHESDNLFYQSINRYPSTQQGVQSNEAVINGATWTMYVRTPGGSIPNHSINNNHCVDADNVYTRLENNVVRLYSNGTYWIVLDGRAV